MLSDSQRGVSGSSGVDTRGAMPSKPGPNPAVPASQSLGFLPHNTTSPEVPNSSNSWTPSSGDFGLLDQDDEIDNRDELITEYNRLAEKYGIRSLVPSDFAPIDAGPLSYLPKKRQGRYKHTTHQPAPSSSLPDTRGNWFYKVLRQTSPGASTNHLPMTYDQKHVHHQRSVSDRAWDMVRQQKNGLRNEDPASLVRLCGKSLFYLPADYAPRPLVLPTCLRATAQALAQQANVRGIFRVPGSIKVINAMYDYYCASSDVGDITRTTRSPTLPSHIKYTPHDIASVFKRILAGLPGGILGSLAVFDALVTIHSQLHAKPENVKTKETKVRARMIALAIGTVRSRYRRELICAVFGLLCLIGRAAENAPREDTEGRPLPTSDLMGYSALGILFGPLLVGDLIDFYSMKVADPAAGLVLLPLTSPKPRKENKKKTRKGKGRHGQKVDQGAPSVLGTIDKICLANNIAEMVITHWREVTRQLRSLDVLTVKNRSDPLRRKENRSLSTSTSDGVLMSEHRDTLRRSHIHGEGVSPSSPNSLSSLPGIGRSRSRSTTDEPLNTLSSKQQRMRSLSSSSSSRPSHNLPVHALSPTVEESSSANSWRNSPRKRQQYLHQKPPPVKQGKFDAHNKHSHELKTQKAPQNGLKNAHTPHIGQPEYVTQPELSNCSSKVAFPRNERNLPNKYQAASCGREEGTHEVSFKGHKSAQQTTAVPFSLLPCPAVAADKTGGSVSEHVNNQNPESLTHYDNQSNEAGKRPSGQGSNTSSIRSPLSPPGTRSSRGPSGYFEMIVPKRRKRAQRDVNSPAISEPLNKSINGAHNMPKPQTHLSETESIGTKSDAKLTRSDFRRRLRNIRARGKKKMAAFSPERKSTAESNDYSITQKSSSRNLNEYLLAPPKGNQGGEVNRGRLSSRPSESAVKNMAVLFDSADKKSSMGEANVHTGRASAEPTPSLSGGGLRPPLSTSKYFEDVSTLTRSQGKSSEATNPPLSDKRQVTTGEERLGVRESLTYPPYSAGQHSFKGEISKGSGAGDMPQKPLHGIPGTVSRPTSVVQAERQSKSCDSSSRNQDDTLERVAGRPTNLGTRIPQPEEPPVAQHMKFTRPASFPLWTSSPSPPQVSLPRRSQGSMQLHETAWKLRRELERKKEECAQLRRRLETREESLTTDSGTLCEQLREARRERDAWRGRALKAERSLKDAEGGTLRCRELVAARKGLVDGSIDGDDMCSQDTTRMGLLVTSGEMLQRIGGNDGMGFSDLGDGAGDVFEDSDAKAGEEKRYLAGPSHSPVRVPARGSSAAKSSRAMAKGRDHHHNGD